MAKFFLWELPNTIESTDDSRSLNYKKTKYIIQILHAVSDPDGPSTLREYFLARDNFPEDWQNLFLKEIESVKESNPEYFDSFINYYDLPF